MDMGAIGVGAYLLLPPPALTARGRRPLPGSRVFAMTTATTLALHGVGHGELSLGRV